MMTFEFRISLLDIAHFALLMFTIIGHSLLLNLLTTLLIFQPCPLTNHQGPSSSCRPP